MNNRAAFTRWALRIIALLVLALVALLYTRRDLVFDLANFIASCF